MQKKILTLLVLLMTAVTGAWAGKQPEGAFDSCTPYHGSIRVRGWAYDPDQPETSIKVHVYIWYGSSVGTSSSDRMPAVGVNTDVDRPDVNNAKSITGVHGFDRYISVPAGTYTVQIYAIDATKDGNPRIPSESNPATFTVTVTGDPYNITYDANGGSGAPDAQQKGEKVQLTLSGAEPTREGYTFKEWNTAQDGSGDSYAPGAAYTADGDATLYAQWEPVTMITVYFTDAQNYGDVNVYYWPNGGDWPGLEMTYVRVNEFGQKIYSAEIPDNVEGIVFNNRDNGKQTVNITENIADEAWWYANEATDDQGHNTVGYVGTYFIGLTSTDGSNWTFQTPDYDVELEVEYFPLATLTAPTAADGLIEGSVAALLTAGTSEEGTLSYALSQSDTQAPTTGWNTTIPTTEGLEAGEYYVWYKVIGDAEHSDSQPQCIAVTIAALPAFAVTIDDAGVDASNWQATPAEQRAGQTVTLKYNGKKKIRSITIEKAAAAGPLATPLTMEALTGGNIVVNIMNIAGARRMDIMDDIAGARRYVSPGSSKRVPDGGGSSNISVKYSVNGGEKTTIYVTTETTTIPVNAGDKVQFYGDATSTQFYGEDPHVVLMGTAETKVYGNIMSLMDEDNYATLTNGSGYNFGGLFMMNENLTDASGLLLPATTTSHCYFAMFGGCTSLTKAPALPATTLAEACYTMMFFGCTSLTTAPALPATELAGGCYEGMFAGCTSLNSVTCLATDITASGCTSGWLDGVATTGTFTKASGATSWPEGSSGIPSGWTVENAPNN